MDYNTYNDSDEAMSPPEKPADSKAWRIIKKIFKYLFVALIVLVWVAVFASILFRGDDRIYKTAIFSDKARAEYEANPGNFEAYKVFPTVFMTDDGSIQLADSVYAATSGEYEIGVRVAWAQLRYCKECDTVYTQAQLAEQLEEDAVRGEGDPYYVPTACSTVHTLDRASVHDLSLYYTVTDSLGNEYSRANFAHRFKGWSAKIFPIKYEYIRISFSGLYFNLDDNIVNSEDSDEVTPGRRYFLNVYDREGGNLMFSACIYDNNTYISDYEYNLPASKYLK